MVWIKRAGWCVAALLLLWAVAWLGVPPLLKPQGDARLTALLGRDVRIGEVTFKPWALDLTLKQLVIARRPATPAASPAASAAPLLELAQLHVDVSMASLFRRAPVIEALELDGSRLHVARTAEGHYDIDDLVARFTPPADAPASEPPRFALYNLQLRDAQIRFDDLHQHYFANHPNQGYCALVVATKVEKFKKTFASRVLPA